MTQPELFPFATARGRAEAAKDRSRHYPSAAGYKVPGTSQAAAAGTDAATLRLAVTACLEQHGPLTADECAARLNRSVLSIRPRFSELRRAGRIEDTGQRRRNQSGKSAVVWGLRSVSNG